jgi:hypothetical protein
VGDLRSQIDKLVVKELSASVDLSALRMLDSPA